VELQARRRAAAVHAGLAASGVLRSGAKGYDAAPWPNAPLNHSGNPRQAPILTLARRSRPTQTSRSRSWRRCSCSICWRTTCSCSLSCSASPPTAATSSRRTASTSPTGSRRAKPQPYTQPAPPLPAPHTSPRSPPHGVNMADWLQAGPRRRPRRRAPCRAPHTAPRYAQYARALASQARRLCSSARRLGERPPLGVMQACKSLAGILARDTHSAPFLSFPGTGT